MATEKGSAGADGAKRSEAEAAPAARRGRPGRRSAEDRTTAVIELLQGKASIDQLATRFGVRAGTIEGWRDEALKAVAAAMRQGSAKSARERELERKLKSLERVHTDLAIRHELVERALKDRPTPPGRSSR